MGGRPPDKTLRNPAALWLSVRCYSRIRILKHTLCAGAQTAEARQRLKGPALLVVDCKIEKVSEDSFYLVEPEEGTQLEIREGGRLNGAAPSAQVLFCCRPPAMMFTSSQETSELLQV